MKSELVITLVDRARGEPVWFPTHHPRAIAGLGLAGAAAGRGMKASTLCVALARVYTRAGRDFFPRSEDIG